MRYYKVISNGYIVAIGTGFGGEEITEAEYTSIADMIANRPNEGGYGYRLTENFEWEQYELPVEEDPELTAEEAMDIILGGTI